MSNIIQIDGIDVDMEKATKMIRRLIVKEKANLRTKEKSDNAMVNIIKDMIKEEVECY
ncbi:hypothetical protein CLRAG_09820 [Clostridium ragsdalei P11]|uniref:Uncharacterized protein n=1 Tax=Clostridium ragsdalei P11 TaxID=1353534 RepID=A0A1A6AYI6_9CLOT|nr:hypothetical protein [Clostridium ragsdalei]OBR95144.1 hypothetical protein CLRAG_09820 [Clostridium ragsdalei P11]